ncbi:hypothetical protein SAMN05216480_10525 [Pustulibacterium marinum]|uniref:Uncharacterized protein n=1 Tax=Pustulibacterium marinum TaxID=1224947 RepID=A0A1I7GKA4_9FLAO|nr:hypothetical protein [Pustulibacterium marinum]SFU48880.1 hypothetical protein SAMN05216480_10525 [Pustulibacterium marinum]
MSATCFEIYFNPVYIYVRNTLLFAADNNFKTTKTSLVASTLLEAGQYVLGIDLFGVSMPLIAWVLITVGFDAWYGIKKSKKQALEAYSNAMKFPKDSPEHRKEMRVYKLKKYDPKKLQFTFFKCFTLLAYLAFAKVLLSEGNGILDFTLQVLTKAPIAIFWYKDFKSIGDNTAYIYKKKAPIFTIVESIFEPRIKKFYGGSSGTNYQEDSTPENSNMRDDENKR